ncbi:MAG: adenylate/guanylate cyclase domain-containing protein [Methylophilaceae bacterium]
MNKTSICSVIALEMIDYANKTNAQQIEIRKQFNDFIQLAVIDIPQNDRVIVDTPHGAVIICTGQMEDALEDALFISLTMRDEILKNNRHSSKLLYVQFGIHLGSVRVLNDDQEQLDSTGEGVDEAQRIMVFANPNQILVSRVYYEMASKLTQEISKMFEQYDMHAHEQDIYAVRLPKDQVVKEESVAIAADESGSTGWQLLASKVNWMYATTSLLVVVAFFALSQQVLKPDEPAITFEQPALAEPSIPPEVKATEEPMQVADPTVALPDLPANTEQTASKKAKIAQKKNTQRAIAEEQVTTNKAVKPAERTTDNPPPPTAVAKSVESKTDETGSNEKSGWQTFKDSIKQGEELKCTQAEIAMNQCR